MFRKKGSSIGEKSENTTDVVAERSEFSKDGISKELYDYVTQLVDSAHGKCISPDILKFVERSK